MKHVIHSGSCHKRYYCLCWLIAFAGNCLLGCRPSGYFDKTSELVSIRPSLPAMDYTSVAWLDGDEIALAYKVPEAREGTIRIAILHLMNGELEDIVTPSHPDSCLPVPSGITFLLRLPNSKLGYLYKCWNMPDSNMPGAYSGTIYLWDRSAHDSQAIQVYSDFLPGEFTVSPDMSEVIQASPVGAGLNDELYRFELGEEGGRQILSDFQRATAPSWSPDGETIIFAGNKLTPYDSPKTNEEMTSLLFYPWTIYQLDADGQEVQELLPGIGYPLLKFSPDGNQLAFSATYKDKPGIWIMDLATNEVTRIWASNDIFDWSPDGKSMIVLARDDDEGNLLAFQTYPTILTLD